MGMTEVVLGEERVDRCKDRHERGEGERERKGKECIF